MKRLFKNTTKTGAHPFDHEHDEPRPISPFTTAQEPPSPDLVPVTEVYDLYQQRQRLERGERPERGERDWNREKERTPYRNSMIDIGAQSVNGSWEIVHDYQQQQQLLREQQHLREQQTQHQQHVRGGDQYQYRDPQQQRILDRERSASFNGLSMSANSYPQHPSHHQQQQTQSYAHPHPQYAQQQHPQTTQQRQAKTRNSPLPQPPQLPSSRSSSINSLPATSPPSNAPVAMSNSNNGVSVNSYTYSNTNPNVMPESVNPSSAGIVSSTNEMTAGSGYLPSPTSPHTPLASNGMISSSTSNTASGSVHNHGHNLNHVHNPPPTSGSAHGHSNHGHGVLRKKPKDTAFPHGIQGAATQQQEKAATGTAAILRSLDPSILGPGMGMGLSGGAISVSQSQSQSNSSSGTHKEREKERERERDREREWEQQTPVQAPPQTQAQYAQQQWYLQQQQQQQQSQARPQQHQQPPQPAQQQSHQHPQQQYPRPLSQLPNLNARELNTRSSIEQERGVGSTNRRNHSQSQNPSRTMRRSRQRSISLSDIEFEAAESDTESVLLERQLDEDVAGTGMGVRRASPPPPPKNVQGPQKTRGERERESFDSEEIDFVAALDEDPEDAFVPGNRYLPGKKKNRWDRDKDWIERDREMGLGIENIPGGGGGGGWLGGFGSEKGRSKEKDKDKEGGLRAFFAGVLDKDKEKEKERAKEKERHQREREKEQRVRTRDRDQRERITEFDPSALSSDTMTQAQLQEQRTQVLAQMQAQAQAQVYQHVDPRARMVGRFVTPRYDATRANMGPPVVIDWALALDICEKTHVSESDAKAIAKSLRKELKYGGLNQKFGAITLWAIILQSGSDVAITQTSTRKFLEVIEDIVLGTPDEALRERILEVLGAAVHITIEKGGKEASKREGFKMLWRRLKPDGFPDEGLPLSAEGPMFLSPRTPIHKDDKKLRGPSVNKYAKNGIIPAEEDMRRLLQECKIGRGNAQLLSDALAFSSPEDLERGLIKEFYSKCCASKELIHMQIPWATAEAERSRQRQLDSGNVSVGPTGELPTTQEERLLEALLRANEELTESLRIFADYERLNVETEVEKTARERSRFEVRGNTALANATEYAASGESSSFLHAPSIAASSSRSPSPSSGQTSQYSYNPSHNSSSEVRQAPVTPNPLPSPDYQSTATPTTTSTTVHVPMPLPRPPVHVPPLMTNSNSSHGHLAINNINSYTSNAPNQTLPLNFNSSNSSGLPPNSSLPPPPTRMLHGPRSPAPSAAVAAAMNVHSYSRSPSPAQRSRPTSFVNSRNGSIDLSSEGAVVGPADATPLASAGSKRKELVYPPSQKSPLSSESSEQESIVQPIPMSEKAAGKRKAADGGLPNSTMLNGYGQGQQDGWRSGMLPENRDLDNVGVETPNYDSRFGYLDDNYNAGGDMDEALGPDRWKKKTTYVYDAAAERTKNRIREGMLLYSSGAGITANV